jgi:gliding motility-associated-like protein
MKRFFLFLCMLYFANWDASSQLLITSEGTLSEEFITRNFITGCAEVSNISSLVNGANKGIASLGSFQKGTSNFPLENGIVLSTGGVSDLGNNLVSPVLGKGDASWGSDLDLEASLGVGGFLNATSIEFDFVTISNTISFRYVFASEEYQDENACNSTFDSFVFLIKELGTNEPYRNIALVPNTNDFIGTGNIRPNLPGLCASQNDAFFESFDDGATNLYGRTKVLTATTAIAPNQSYHIKLVIADQGDQFYDSAVFIEGNTFDASIDLGTDVETCSSDFLLSSNLESPLVNYEWFYEGVEIGGAYQSQYNATESGTYSVRATMPMENEVCVVEDTIEVVLNKEQTIESISDFANCDTNNPGDQVEIFDLSTKNTEILSKLSSSNHTISYHFSEDESKSNSNQITTPIRNTAVREKIYVRAENQSNGCLAYGSFFIQVNEVLLFTAPEPIIVCSEGNDPLSNTIDFAETTETIQNGNPNRIVSYHESRSNALSGTDAIETPYFLRGSNQTIYFRVEDVRTTCSMVSNVDASVFSRPNITYGDYIIDGCELTNDGSEVFDITIFENEILGGLADVNISYHKTESDAVLGADSISNTKNYPVNNFQESVFIRVEDNNSKCASIERIVLATDLLLTGTNIGDFSTCNDSDTDGIGLFDLNVIESKFANGLEGVSFQFFEDEEKRDRNIEPLDKNTVYTNTNPWRQTLYVRVNSSECEEIADFDLVVQPNFELEPLEVQEVCDEDEDLQMLLNLGTYDAYVSNGIPGTSVRYYLNEYTANNALGSPIPKNYNTTTNPQVVYGRVENQNGCVAVNRLEIQILPGPTVSEPSDIYICDDDDDNLFRVGLDLEYKIEEITAANAEDVSVVFYTSRLDAENETDPITDPGNFETSPREIYARVTNTVSNCFEITSFSIFISPKPIFKTIEPYKVCANEEGMGQFLFATKDNEILSGQTAKEVLYFESEEDADARRNPIDKESLYQNTTNPQTIHVRIQNTEDAFCYILNSFEIEANPMPIFNNPTDEEICYTAGENGYVTFDFRTKIYEITEGASQNLEVTFHKSETDANNQRNALDYDYTNDASQTIYVRVETEDNCFEIVDFRINLFKTPLLGDAQEYKICDEDYDGKTIVDLTGLDLPILDPRLSNYLTTFYATANDLSNDISISDPANYEVDGSTTLYVKIVNNTTGCFAETSLDLVVELPPVYTSISSYEFCETTDNFVNLNEITPSFELAESATLVYYRSRTDAESQRNGTVNRYQYFATNETVYVRFESSNGCSYIDQFDLIVNSNPEIVVPQDVVGCDAFGDGSALFDFSSIQDAVLLNGASASDFTITYHNTEENASNGTDVLSVSYRAVDGEQIWFRVENNRTGCWSVDDFYVIVNPLPLLAFPSLDSQGEFKICDEDYDGKTIIDLTTLEIQILNEGRFDYLTTFYATANDLSNDISISDPANYEVDGSTTLYVKIVNNTTGCFAETSLDLVVELPPVYTSISSYEFCETTDNFVNLNEITPSFELAESATLVYYRSRTDAESQRNGTVNRYQYFATNETVYVRFESSNGCSYIDQFDLIVNSNPEIVVPQDVVGCDAFGDGSALFDFSSIQDAVLLNGASASDFTITYHNTEENASNGTDVLSVSYRAVDGEQIWFRVENNRTGCWSVDDFYVIVNPLPVIDVMDTHTVCLDGNSFVLRANNSSTDTYEWSTGERSQSIEIAKAGPYFVKVTNEYGCNLVKEFTVNSATLLGIDVFHFQQPSKVSVEISGNGNYEYQLDESFPQSSNVFEDVSVGTHRITIYETNGCGSLNRNIFVLNHPLYFTPEGTLPYWHILGMDTITGMTATKVFIYDRNGRLVGILNENSPGWDGTDLNGVPLPATDYWFSADVMVDGNHIIATGNFSLVR